jgi:hypothetical protein
MARVGTMNVIVKFNTKNLSIPLKIFAIPAKAYICIANSWYKLRHKGTVSLGIKIDEIKKEV